MTSALPPHDRLRTLKRLWLAATALLTLLVSLVIGNALLPEAKRLTGNMVGHDFLAFYTAGSFVRDGRSHDLYRLERVKAFQHDLARREGIEIGESFGPFWNPPFYAWVFVPLAALPFKHALAAWELVNAACLVAAIALLIRLCSFRGGERDAGAGANRFAQRNLLLIPVFFVTSMPLIQAFSHGQNTMVSLLLLTLAVTFWRADKAVPAAVAASLLMYKPQLGFVIAAAIAVTMNWRAAATLVVCGLGLLCVNAATLPGTLDDYRAFMPGNLRQFQVDQPYLWHRHVTLRAFWRMLFQGRATGEMSAAATACWAASWAALAATVARAWWRTRGRAASGRGPLIAAVVAAMPLLMPFYFDYDLLLVGVAAVLYVSARLAQGAVHPADRYLTPAWCALYAWLMVNVSVTGETRVNGTVILLSAVAGLLAWRARDAKELAAEPSSPLRRVAGEGSGSSLGAPSPA
jgi:hypothetical protein